MADVTKGDWQKLSEELRSLSGRIQSAEHQLQTLTDRANKAESFQAKVEPNMWFVTGARVILGLSAVAVATAVVSVAFWLGALGSDVKHHDELLAELKKVADESRETNARLEERTRILADIVQKRVTFMSSRFREGTVVEVKGDELIVKVDPDQKEIAYKLKADGEITIHGKPGKLADLKPGTKVRVGVQSESQNKGEAAWIETADTPPPPPPLLPSSSPQPT